MDAPPGELAVGRVVRYGGLDDPFPGTPYVAPLVGDDPAWLADPEYLRAARPDEIARAHGGAS
ncbi:hypothetical protein AB0I10_39120 [Streptomyces sp. NPDC050636]|uniref:hypothetical protein n=1 Tax=Streptomyces sp. NPDC050636 TaxID=3154510 RepID=UPI00341384A6